MNTNNPTKEQLAAAFSHAWGDDSHMIEYCVKKTDIAIKLSTGAIFTIDKRKINTRFCFGYSTCGQGAEYEDAIAEESRAAASIDYFRRENTKASAAELNQAKTAKYMYTYVHYSGDNVGAIVSVLLLDEPAEFYRKHNLRCLPLAELNPVNDVDRAAIIAAYEQHHAKHCKRVDTYIKRYGLSKIKTWTYWVDE